MGKVDGLDVQYVDPSDKRLQNCANMALLPRLNSWALAHIALYMLSPRYPKGNWGKEEFRVQWAQNFLKRLDLVLSNDLVISKDLGGEAVTSDIIERIRNAIKLLDSGQELLPRKEVLFVSRHLFMVAVNRFADCIMDDEDPLEGVSTTRKRRKQPELYKDE